MGKLWVRVFEGQHDYSGYVERFDTEQQMHDFIKDLNDLIAKGKVLDFEVCDY